MAFVIILLGPPGSGKGTQATPLSHHLGIPHISTGDLFRAEIRNGTPLGLIAKQKMDAGHLVPDSLVFDILHARISQPDCAHGFLLDGFPRTLAQGVQLTDELKGRFETIVLSFQIHEEELIQRIGGRLTCKGCARPYHLKLNPPQAAGKCDACGSELFQRTDDSVEVVRERLKVYRQQTAPLLDYYATQTGVLRTVSASLPPEEVFQEILKELPALISR